MDRRHLEDGSPGTASAQCGTTGRDQDMKRKQDHEGSSTHSPGHGSTSTTGDKRRWSCQADAGTSSVFSKAKRRHQFLLSTEERAAFYTLLGDDIILAFLAQDICLKISDKYLLAMVIVYFKRAGLPVSEYTRMNFFVALFLANQVEEENPSRNQIYRWALGSDWHHHMKRFHQQRQDLWRRMDFQALVSLETCEQIMALDPTHWVWRRNRKEHHGWAIRRHLRREKDLLLRGPGDAPLFCGLCYIFTEQPAPPGTSDQPLGRIMSLWMLLQHLQNTST